ncbi:MAG: substrate-binding domain-containing protein, partial [Pirellulales bacterium]|nr:substrate-binding domain-containing protein [Pirellulales bacterium]
MKRTTLTPPAAICAVLAANLTLSIVGLPGCKSDAGGKSDTGGKKRIVFLTNGDDPFWDACRKGMDDAAEELKIEDAGLTHVMDKGSEFDRIKQLEKLKELATRSDVAGLAISPVDAKNARIAKALEELKERGVKIICVDSDMDPELRHVRFSYLGTDNITGGRELGKAAKGLRPEGGKYATFVGTKSQLNASQRIQGFAEGAGDKFTEVASLDDNADPPTAQQNARTVLQDHKDIGTMVGIWAYNAHAIVRALEKEIEDPAERDAKTVVVFDAAEVALKDMSEGKIDAMVVQNPYQMGRLSVTMLKALIEDDGEAIKEVYPSYDPKTGEFTAEDGDIFNTELRVVVPDASSPLKKEMFRDETIFF